MSAVTPKFSFVRQSKVFAYVWFDKRVAFNGVKHSVVTMALPPHRPLDGEAVHVHGLARGKQLAHF